MRGICALRAAARPGAGEWEGRLTSTQRRHPHALHLRLDEHQHESARDFAQRRGLTLTAAVRLLLERGVAGRPSPADGDLAAVELQLRSLNRAVIASLIASESARLAVEAVFRHDSERLLGLADRAARAARARLSELEEAESEV